MNTEKNERETEKALPSQGEHEETKADPAAGSETVSGPEEGTESGTFEDAGQAAVGDGPKSGKKKPLRIILAAAAAFLALCAGVYGLAVGEILRGAGPVSVALDEPVRVPVCEDGLLSLLCEPDPPLASYDTSEVGTRTGEIVAGWVFRRRLTVTVEDRTPPG